MWKLWGGALQLLVVSPIAYYYYTHDNLKVSDSIFYSRCFLLLPPPFILANDDDLPDANGNGGVEPPSISLSVSLYVVLVYIYTPNRYYKQPMCTPVYIFLSGVSTHILR